MTSFEILQNIRKLREYRNLNQEHLAEKLGITTRNYRNIENGASNLSLDRFLIIASILSIDPATLLTLHTQDNPPVRLNNGYLLSN